MRNPSYVKRLPVPEAASYPKCSAKKLRCEGATESRPLLHYRIYL